MELELNETQRLVRETARGFAQQSLAPRANEFERAACVPASVYQELAGLGLMAVNIPEALGGSEAGVVAYSLAMSEIAAACASTAVGVGVTNMVGELIAAFGSDAQRKRHNPQLAAGALGAFALSEAEAGSDPGAMRTTATRERDEWVLRGRKQWISHGDTAAVLVVWARTGQAGARGLSCFLVEGGTAGLTAGKHEDKMGLRASHTVELSLDDVRVPADALLGELGGGFRLAMVALDGGRIGIASQALGIARAAFGAASSYACERKAFGHPIGDFQAIQWKLADARRDLDAGHLLAMRAAWLKEQGKPLTRAASMAKLFCSEAAWRICNQALQIHAGYGYTSEFPVERHLRDVRVARIYEGTSEIQRLVIARALL